MTEQMRFERLGRFQEKMRLRKLRAILHAGGNAIQCVLPPLCSLRVLLPQPRLLALFPNANSVQELFLRPHCAESITYRRVQYEGLEARLAFPGGLWQTRSRDSSIGSSIYNGGNIAGHSVIRGRPTCRSGCCRRDGRIPGPNRQPRVRWGSRPGDAQAVPACRSHRRGKNRYPAATR